MRRLYPGLGILLLSTLLGCAASPASLRTPVPGATSIAVSDLDADSAADLLLTVHEELGSGYKALTRAQRMRQWAALMCVTGIAAPLVTAGDSSDSYLKISVAFVATGVATWAMGLGKGARAANQIREAYERLDAAVLGEPYLTPEERGGPRRKTRFAE